ncbi:ATP-binding domain-containing protein 3-like protein, partial [Dinothrombium tinctorium]
MKTLDNRYDYGHDLVLLSIDERIADYRDDLLESLEKFSRTKICADWSMDEISLSRLVDRGAALLNADKILASPNADDIAELYFGEYFNQKCKLFEAL